MKRKTLEVTLMGMKYRVTKSTRLMLRDKLPVPVVLEREPENEYDENALKVLAGEAGAFTGMALGYVGRKVAAQLAPKMDIGEAFYVSGQLTTLDVDTGEGDLLLIVKLA